MRQSQLFSKTRREDPAGEESVNARLLIRGGFVHKEMAGVYAYLPLGLRVLKNIERVIREEMNAIGGQELLLTTLQDPDVWEKTGRWSDKVMDNWFKTKLANGKEVGIASTHEEPLTQLLKHHVSSYKDLPVYVYQFQTKFRNELRAKSGVMRGREFLMKDMYSFSRTQEELQEFYELAAAAYLKIFFRLRIGELTYRTAAAGGSFTSGLTDEFQTLCEAGEDIIYVDKKKKRAINKEVYTDETIAAVGLNKEDLVQERTVEVGNIFPLGTKYAEALGLHYRDEKGEEKPVIMGSYGIGVGRLMGVLAEVFHDENGLRWPREAAPFQVHLLQFPGGERSAEGLYKKLTERGVEVLYDERELSAGEKLADADLLGIPLRAVVSRKTAGRVEVKERSRDGVRMLTEEEFRTECHEQISP